MFTAYILGLSIDSQMRPPAARHSVSPLCPYIDRLLGMNFLHRKYAVPSQRLSLERARECDRFSSRGDPFEKERVLSGSCSRTSDKNRRAICLITASRLGGPISTGASTGSLFSRKWPPSHGRIEGVWRMMQKRCLSSSNCAKSISASSPMLKRNAGAWAVWRRLLREF